MKILPLIFAFISAILPVVTQKTGLSAKYGFKIKMLCALMYIITGIVSVSAISPITYYAFFILGALFSGFLGDFFLSYKNDRYFPVGVGFFALGHIIYSFTFLLIGETKAIEHIIPVTVMTLILFIAVVYIIKTKLNLGKIEKPVMIYALLLFFSFACGVANGIIAIKNGNFPMGLCMITASILFVVSDILLGLKTGGMKLPAKMRHMVTYTYFPAQTLFALSIYFQ